MTGIYIQFVGKTCDYRNHIGTWAKVLQKLRGWLKCRDCIEGLRNPISPLTLFNITTGRGNETVWRLFFRECMVNRRPKCCETSQVSEQEIPVICGDLFASLYTHLLFIVFYDDIQESYFFNDKAFHHTYAPKTSYVPHLKQPSTRG